MKKILSLTLVLLMIFSLTFMVSCNDEEPEQMLYTEDVTLGTGTGALLFTVEHIDGTMLRVVENGSEALYEWNLQGSSEWEIVDDHDGQLTYALENPDCGPEPALGDD